ncbi:hypothetical protein KAI52_01345 [Candidatus Parcubacteria bacterium]|nr:hypothetical protein [Candidatus Parcubacteria bacterium]
MGIFLEKSKLNSKDIRETLRKIDSLDYKQREVFEEICEKYDYNGVNEFEFAKILREIKKDRVELGFSKIDIRNIENAF